MHIEIKVTKGGGVTEPQMISHRDPSTGGVSVRILADDITITNLETGKPIPIIPTVAKKK